ncbi:MAG TPA: hypothetical protein VF469_11790 [Kofleriaceae bacterium]
MAGEGDLLIELIKLVGQLIWLVLRLLWWLLRSAVKLLKPKPLASRLPAATAPAAQVVPAERSRPAAIERAAAERRMKLDRALPALERRAAAMAETARLERANRRFVNALTEFFPQELARVRQLVRDTKGELRPGLERAAGSLAAVLDEIEALMAQRRDPELRAKLGDADRLADVCYQPIIDFARAKGLPLTTGYPATRLTEFDMAIWVGFIPTSIAPIFLPREFFDRTAWWPALCHEIGHDFLASVRGLEPRLREDLDLPSAELGSQPLVFGRNVLNLDEIPRLFGGWFEELFCDVFGTMMCGPAYVATMMRLFRATSDVREILVAPLDETGRRYDPHPPRHLRLLAGCTVLERAGLHADARRLRAEWEARHTQARGPDRILFHVGGGAVPLPLELFTPLLTHIVERLYTGPCDALGGFGLQDVSGLDYGPHEHAESLRARDALLRGKVPIVRDPRAVVAGAVFAALARPDAEAQILANARAAIPALGTGETLPDPFGDVTTVADRLRLDRAALVDAVVLREVLARPRVRRF